MRLLNRVRWHEGRATTGYTSELGGTVFTPNELRSLWGRHESEQAARRAAAVALIAILPDGTIDVALKSLEALLERSGVGEPMSFEDFLEFSPGTPVLGEARLGLNQAPSPVFDWDY
jgi:hypothetical protein